MRLREERDQRFMLPNLARSVPVGQPPLPPAREGKKRTSRAPCGRKFLGSVGTLKAARRALSQPSALRPTASPLTCSVTRTRE